MCFTSFSNHCLPVVRSFHVSVPYTFTSFSNCAICIIARRLVSVPYTFTSFSNRGSRQSRKGRSFSTIYFYIILKHALRTESKGFVSVPYTFTSFSNSHTLHRTYEKVSVPYTFTSFSNLCKE